MYILKVAYNYDDCILKTTEAYNMNPEDEIIYIHKDNNEWLALTLKESDELVRQLLIKTREVKESVGLIKPFHLQSEEYKKSVAKAMREDEEE